jgi:murein DD-endopeptidase MepM/ murein hydrolase activator NlpD
MSESLDNTQAGVTGSFTAEPDSSDVFIPGVAVDLQGIGNGVGSFDGVYLVTGLTLDLNGKSPGTISLSQPLDPVPGNPGAIQKEPTSGKYQTQYPYVAPGPLSGPGWTWFAAGNIKGSVGAGVSIYGSLGEAVTSPVDGTVVKTAGTSGAVVRISVGGNLYVEMSHMDSVTVRLGQTVSRGQKIGTMGPSTGNTAYAHAQVFNGTVQVNPTPYFPVIP